MNRIIKFRVWDKEYKEFSNWTNRDPHFSINTGQIFFWERVKNQDGTYDGDIILEDLNDRFVLQQFTGLKDKKGREIYEGDVLWSHSKFLVGFGQYRDAEHEGHTGFWLKSERFRSEPFGFGEWYDEKISEIYEVVGNIFENPELAKLFGEI